MTTNTNNDLSPAAIRAWFAEQPAGALFTMPAISKAFGAAPGAEHRRLASSVRCGFLCGYLERMQFTAGTAYRLSGKCMRRDALSEEERRARSLANQRARHERRRRAKGITPVPNRSKLVRAARVNLQAAGVPQPTVVAAVRATETVEQFLARGGRVQRLPAHWEQMERAA
ncbi:hypothetical protein ACPEH7_02060 [Stenotrophomonas sp. NPDC101269]|uniref:hypothetical protein n=1 Tax=Stenotrophomonas sp. NPDC101269 TaxID=3415003 RepID=UPI003C30A62D